MQYSAIMSKAKKVFVLPFLLNEGHLFEAVFQGIFFSFECNNIYLFGLWLASVNVASRWKKPRSIQQKLLRAL